MDVHSDPTLQTPFLVHLEVSVFFLTLTYLSIEK